MTGQPNYPGFLVFDVTNLEIDEPQPPIELTEEILDLTEPFSLTVTFRGTGMFWNALVNMFDPQYEACFYLEGRGQQAAESDLGCATGNVAAASVGGGNYEATHQVNGIQQKGLYKVGVTVEFPGLWGLLGHYDDLMIQVSRHESPTPPN